MTTLQAALAAAQPGDEIWVAAGNYTPTSQSLGFAIPSGVRLYGGFAGTESSLQDRAADTSLHATNFNGASSVHHIVTVPSGATVVIDRVTLQNASGNAPVISEDVRGGGLYSSGANITLSDCTVRQNSSGRYLTATSSPGSDGGGAFLSHCTLTCVRCIFSNNRASSAFTPGCFLGTAQPGRRGGNGGAIAIDGGSARFVDCVEAIRKPRNR